MIYYCADDYGLCHSVSARIQRCIDKGSINKVSVFPNFDKIDFDRIAEDKKIRISLHLNLVEGSCMAMADEVSLLADKNGDFKHTFGGLLKESILHRKRFEAQVYNEIRAQVLKWKSILPEEMAFCIDSHQHTHMIPCVFKALIRVVKDEDISLQFMRIPVEPVLPYVKTPSLYFTYKPVNIIKQWLLKLFWIFNKKYIRKYKIQTAYFMGILFSGGMDAERVSRILPKYKKLAEKNGRDIEVLFHPGYMENDEFENKNVAFKDFYLSQNRKMEYDSIMKITERSV